MVCNLALEILALVRYLGSACGRCGVSVLPLNRMRFFIRDCSMDGFPVSPFQGLFSLFTFVPRALPWAVMLPPLRGKISLKKCRNSRPRPAALVQGMVVHKP